MIKAVVFDFGGVLVRTESPAGRVKWEQQLGLRPGDLSRAVFESEVASLATIGQLSEDAIWQHVAGMYHLAQGQIDELRADFWSGDRLDSRLVEFLSSLRPAIKTAILSNAWSGARLVFIERYALHTAVDLIIISAEEGLAKPDAAIYQVLTRRLGLLPQETVFVDDFAANVEAARAAGIRGVLFMNTDQAIRDVSALISSPEGVMQASPKRENLSH